VIDRYLLDPGQAPGLSNPCVPRRRDGADPFQAEAPPGTYFLRVLAANE
jgi:hypothetical protein